ncbi:hypothetical protein A5634_12290 [Mycobacterium asiaticum]|uniref:Transmembrane protein n=1 Tax=Mycobacterium asiaticum TaxID=1790 RepID=A0A1A3NJV9_MYCAS|nr:hypothetical protein [Mycobacterium asiaticum]OBK20647.1 hypothetical protein A5634_12290 [Mycobacterium asiaticum]
MGRKVAILWHASFSIGAGVLYYFCVLPRWHELVGDLSRPLGTTLRIVTGALIGLAALPVVFTLLRTRRPELGAPQLALSLRTWSIVAHVLAGVLIIGTAISEIWLSLDSAGQYLFAIYGAAAAIFVLGFFGFYLSFIAELPPPPPKPIKPKKVKEPRSRLGKRRGKAVATGADDEDEDDLDADDTDDAEAADDAEPAETEEAPAKITLDKDASPKEQEAADTETAETVEAPVPTAAEQDQDEAEASAETVEAPVPSGTEKTVEAAAAPRLRNRRPTGKTSHRRRRTRGGVAVEE